MAQNKPSTIAETSTGAPIAAWLLKCDPTEFDLAAAFHTGGGKIPDWPLAQGYRWTLMNHGDPCFLWVAGPDRSPVPAGIYAAGMIQGRVRPGGDRRAPGDAGDATANGNDRAAEGDSETAGDDGDPGSPRVDCEVVWLEAPILRDELLLQPDFAGAEVLRMPQMGNPNFLTPDEMEILETFAFAEGKLTDATLAAFAGARAR